MVMNDNDLKERKIKFKPRIKSNHNIYTAFTTAIFCAFSPIHCLQELNIHRGTQPEYSSKPVNIALLNVFQYLNGRYRLIFYPLKTFHLFGFPI